tara:strand:- start:580 stop:975 length:396 start_codon:yes stop_codon:yes gene_type:complete
MPLTDYKEKNFDIDLDFGKKGEKLILEIFEGNSSIEVKTERDKWLDTGNLVIEYRYKGNPSGISVTKAKWWIHILMLNGKMKFSFIFPVSVLKRKIKSMLADGTARTTMGGDDNMSSLILVPIKGVIKNEL